MTAKGGHPASSRWPAAVFPVARWQDEIRSGADAMVSRYGWLALRHVRHLTLAEGSLVTRLLERRRSTRSRCASHRRQWAQKRPIGLRSGRTIRQDAAMARRSGMRPWYGFSPRWRSDLFYSVLVLVAVADLRGCDRRRCACHGAGRHRRAACHGWTIVREWQWRWLKGYRRHWRRRRRWRRWRRAAGAIRTREHVERPLSLDLLSGCFLRVVLGHAGTSAHKRDMKEACNRWVQSKEWKINS